MAAQKMTVSNGRGADAIGVEVTLRSPKNDADWRTMYNITPAERDAKALRQVRVDIANGGARDALREGIKMGLKGKKLQEHVQTFVDGWRSGARTTKVPVQDLRKLEGILGAEQLAAVKESAEEQGFHVLITEKQEAALDALAENETGEN